MNPDFFDMLSALSGEGAEYLLVGAHALAAHGLPRATGDIDIWIRPSPENAERVWRALVGFGAAIPGASAADLEHPGWVFQLGVVPRRIDLMTSIDGVEFDDAWPNRLVVMLGTQPVPILGRLELIRNKRAVGRPQDLADAARLEEAK